MNWDYIAGFFDGEGNINIVKNQVKRSHGIQLRLYSSDEKVLLEIKNFLRKGQMYKVKRFPATNYIYELTITKKKNVQFFLKNILNRVIIKRTIVKYVLKNFNFERANNREFDIPSFRNLNQKNKGNVVIPLTE